MENFAEPPGLIAEQLWDLPSDGELKYSYPSGSAMPLAWAHAEYITLVRSATDGAVFDLLPAVAERYLAPHSRSNLEIWNFYRQIDVIDRSEKLRIILAWPFRLHWSNDGWAQTFSTDSSSPAPGLFFVDLPPLMRQGTLLFTFYWTRLQQWQQIDYRVNVK
ncbi:MAG: hypothetical protein WCB94_19925 [Terriglobales bacterium]